MINIKSKSIKKLKKLESEFHNTFQDIHKKIKKELKNEFIKMKAELIKNISVDYNLDYNELYHKYIDENHKFEENTEKSLKEQTKNNEVILDQITIKDKIYFQDSDGNIYNEHAKIIGTNKDKQFKSLLTDV